ncbi:hypothetical protein [Nocardiopsis valliformis]|uniref:hypothetical protein n=1 Tax=Nocardiopsis valliformis TaxID=239974 RepID=UPI00034BBCDC|nr:hypothetical protein [Nocardiopsis valliformis]
MPTSPDPPAGILALDPSDPRHLGPFRRAGRALWLSAAASTLVVALVGGLVYSDQIPWGNGAADGEEEAVAEEDPGPVVRADPEDGPAVAAEAIGLLREAPDLLYRHDTVGHPEQAHSAARVLEYTETPVPVYRLRTYDPAGVAIRLRHGDDMEESTVGLIGMGQDVPDVVYYEQTGTDVIQWEPTEDLDWGLELILEPGAEIEYQGRSRVPYQQEFTDGGVSVGVSFEETEGYHYSGAVRDPSRSEGEEGDPMTFDLWIDNEGRPLRFHGSAVLDYDVPGFKDAVITITRDYDYREQDIHAPDESEILPDRPERGA